MTAGIVTAGLEAIVRLRFRGPNAAESVVDGIVDTGFTGYLTIPISTAASLLLGGVCANFQLVKRGSPTVRPALFQFIPPNWNGKVNFAPCWCRQWGMSV